MPIKDRLICISEGVLIIFSIGYLFYGNIVFGIFLLPYLIIFYRNYKKDYLYRRQNERLMQFKDGMSAINSALSAGYSMENSFRKALGELKVLYGDKSDIVREFEQINYRLGMNGNVENALQRFAENINLEDAHYFSEVFRYAKRSGGNMTDIIRKTTENISGKLEVKREINTLTSGRRMEQKIMSIIPFAIIFYIRIAAYEFVKPLYGNAMGAAVMSICLIIYLIAIHWSKIIMDIEV